MSCCWRFSRGAARARWSICKVVELERAGAGMGSRRMRFASLIPALILSACGGPQTLQSNGADNASAPPASANQNTASETEERPSNAMIVSNESSLPDVSASPLEEAMKGEIGARHMLGQWAGALERGDWPMARSLWGDGGARSGFSPAEFAAVYTKYRRMKVTVAAGRLEGAAGSLYYEAPVVISGIDVDEKPFRLEGTIVARRVNDVDGARPEQLRWHIDRSAIKTAPFES